MSLTLSVIIPTIGREAELLSVIDSLHQQTRLPDEIVVIDQNNPPSEKVSKALSQSKLVKHFIFPDAGVCKNYNRGIERASSKVILFLDDDVEISSDLIENHLKNYLHDPKVGGVAGGILQPIGDLPPSQIREVGKYHPLTGKVVAHFNADKFHEVDFAQGANMSYLREAVESAGRCDLNFIGNGYFFEPDLGMTIRKKGYRIVFDPKTTVKHLMAPRGGARVTDKALHTYYFIHNGLLLAKKHSPRWVVPFIAARSLGYAFLKSGYNLNPRIFGLGVKAIFDSFSR